MIKSFLLFLLLVTFPVMSISEEKIMFTPNQISELMNVSNKNFDKNEQVKLIREEYENKLVRNLYRDSNGNNNSSIFDYSRELYKSTINSLEQKLEDERKISSKQRESIANYKELISLLKIELEKERKE